MKGKLVTIISAVILLSMILSACQTPADNEIIQTVIVEGTPQTIVVTATPNPDSAEPAADEEPVIKKIRANFTSGDVPTIDPAVAQDSSAIQILEETYVGLTRMDEIDSTIVPGIAESWDISEDGLTYTFHLRKDIPWVRYNPRSGEVEQVLDCEGNPRMVTADDVVYGTLRTLTPATASPYAYLLKFVLDGASEFSEGDTTDPETVGITAIDELTLEMNFIAPAAYNINIAGMWPATPQPKWLIEGDDCTEARNERWIEAGVYQSYGPYALKEWVHDYTISLIKNPFWPGTDDIPQPKIDEIEFLMLDDTAAFAEYEAGNMDVALHAPIADLDRIKADPVLSQELHISPQFSTYFYGFNTKAPVVDDVRVRRALSLAVDRESLIDKVLKGDQEPAGWFCRPGLVACPTHDTHPSLGVKYDPEQARQILDEYLQEKGLTADKLDISLFINDSSGHQRIAEAIQQMWKDALGINVQIQKQEWKVFLETTKSRETPQVWRMGWNLDYPDANNFIHEVMSVNGNANPADDNGEPYGGINWKNERFEELCDQAAVEMDPQKRIEMYAEAEQILVWEDAAIIPIYWYTSVEVTRPYIVRTYANSNTQHFEKWDIVN